MNSLKEAKSSTTDAIDFEFAFRKDVNTFESKATSKALISSMAA